MRFEIRHSFPCTPEALWEIVDAPEFEERVGAITDTRRETVVATDDDGVRVRRLKVSLKRDLPAPMRKVLGGDTISYDQETRRKLGTNELTWEITPMVLRDRFVGRGTTKVRATSSGCERVITGELTIKVPFVGGAMEERLISDVRVSYDRAADLVREMLSESAS